MEKVNVYLPKKFDLVVGDTFQMFYRGIIDSPNPYIYDILAVCEKGRNCPRYFEFTFTDGALTEAKMYEKDEAYEDGVRTVTAF